MDPITLGLAGFGAATSLFGGILGAGGAQAGAAAQAAASRFRAQAEHDAAMYNAALDEYSADISDRDRGLAAEQTLADAKDIRRKNLATMGNIRAAYGQSGLEMTGSLLDVLQDTAQEQALDVAKELWHGEVVQAGLLDKAAQARAHASLLRAQAQNALIAGAMGADAATTAGNYGSASALISGIGAAFRSFTPSAYGSQR